MPSSRTWFRTIRALAVFAALALPVLAHAEEREEREIEQSALVAPVPGDVPGARLPVRSAQVNFTQLARSQRAVAPAFEPRMWAPPEHEAPPEPSLGFAPPSPAAPAKTLVPLVASPSPINSFQGLDDIAMADSGYIIIPPDVHGAVGPSHVMCTFNNNYRVQNKTTGATILTLGTATFWNPVVSDKTQLNALSDPRLEYDPVQGRWITSMFSYNLNGIMLLGVSQTSDPTGTWNLYSLNPVTTTTSMDFDQLGFNKNWICISVNRYSSAGAFQRGITLIYNYPQAAAGTLSSVTNILQASATHFCTAPCITYSATEDTLFLVTHLSSGSATYEIDRITGVATISGGTPTYTSGGTLTRTGGGWTQPSGSILPQSAPNSGASSCGATPCPLETQDSQVRSEPVYRVDSTTGRGYIYYAQTIELTSPATRTMVQWTKVTPSTTAAFADGGRIDDSSGATWYAYPHLAVNAVGDMLVGYSVFGSSRHPSAGYSYRDHTDGLGTTRDPLIYKAGEDYYNKQFTTARNRWGDYSKAQVDPSDDRTLWTLQEYAKARTSTDDGTTGANGSKWSSYWAAVSTGFTITATAGANGSISPSGTVTVAQGGNQTFTITPNACYSIANVLVDGVSQGAISSYTFTNVQANHTISATFAINTFAITASAGANGSISPNGTTNVNCGANQAYTITPAACYSVANVLVDGVSQGAVTSYTFTNVQAAHTISATFALKTYTITASAGANGSISPSGATVVNCGASQAYSIAPAACYSIADVLVDGVSQGAVASYTFTNVQATHTISATFSLKTYTITASAGANGSISPSGATVVNCGASQAYAIAANSGYYVQDVLVDGGSIGGVAAYTFTNVQAAHTIAASFALDVATIGVTSTSSVLCPTNTCVTVPVTLSRNGTTPVLGYSVWFQLSPELTLCSGTSSVVEGAFLAGSGGTLYQVVDHGGGLYSVDDAVSGTCGPTATGGTLFTISVSSSSASGPGTITLGTLKLRDCNNVALSTTAGPPATVPIDNAAPVVALTAPNGGEQLTPGTAYAITWTATDNVGVANVDLAYSTDGGSTYPNTIATAAANTGSYAWTVPNAPSATVRVRVTAHDVNCSSAADASDANFSIGTYTITASAGAGGSIAPAGATTVGYGGSQAYAIAADPCYSILDVTVDGNSIGAVASYTFSNVQANHTIAASFVLNSYTILATAGAGGSISPSGFENVSCGDSRTFTVTPDACYSIADVQVDGASVGAVASYTFTNVTASHTIAASFSLNTYTITASAGAGGSISPNGATSVGCGGSQAYSIAADPCYSILDVTVDGNSIGAVASYTFTNVQANHTIAASFVLNSYTILATAGAGGSIAPSGYENVSCGDSRTFTITPDACYTIADVQVDGASVGAVASYTFTNVTASHTIAASFALNTYTITASAGAGGSISPNGATSVGCGGSQAYAIAAGPCYSILDVTVDGNSVGAVTSYTFSNVQANHTIAASFVLNSYTILATAGAGGSIAPSGFENVSCGDSRTFTITPDACYSIADVQVDGASVGAVASYTFTNVTASHTIAASFSLNTYTITSSAGAGGSISPNGATSVGCGGSQAYSIAADACHAIADVLVDGNSIGAVASYTFSNVQANHTIAASFSLNSYTITASAGANGSIAPNGATSVNCGGSQAYAITPAACYHVADVLVDGGSVGAVTSYTFTNVTASHTIAASFAFTVAAVPPVTGLASTQALTGNDADGTTKIQLAFTTPGGTTVEVWRKGFGGYPQYDGAGGAAPVAPGAYPPAGWTLTAVTAGGQSDEPATRDFWYYVAYAKDACGNVSAASALTSGALNYHLGDVTDGVTNGQGNNTVNAADLSLLGAHYGASGAALTGFAYLDVGPTTDRSITARPTTDAVVDFEDLMLFALDYTPRVSLLKGTPNSTASGDQISANGPASVTAGQDFDVPVVVNGGGNDLLGVAVKLKWNAAVAAPTGLVTAGTFLTSQGGTVLSPGLGRADAALLGPPAVITGMGTVAMVRFHASASGAPQVEIDQVTGRDNANQDVSVQIMSGPLAVVERVTLTELQPVIPNPAPGHATIAYAIAKPGPVDVAIYSVDGRRVKTLAHATQQPGRYQFRWDGTDDRGAVLRSGAYFVRLDAGDVRRTRLVTLMR